MGKGSRNRALHTQDSIAKPYKAQAKKKAQAPQWLLPLFIIVILAAVVFVAIFSAVSDSGVFPRNRVLIKSQSGKYDVTQQTATFVAWQSLYTFYSYYYEYLSQSDSSTASSSIPEGYTKETYPVALAQYGIENSARDCVEDVLDDLLNYVAVCDKAYAEGMTLTEEDQAEVEKEIALLKNLQEKTNLSTFNIFGIIV